MYLNWRYKCSTASSIQKTVLPHKKLTHKKQTKYNTLSGSHDDVDKNKTKPIKVTISHHIEERAMKICTTK